MLNFASAFEVKCYRQGGFLGTKNDKIMKYEITFSEMAEIFKAIARIEEMEANHSLAESEYQQASIAVDNLLDTTGRVDGVMLDKKIAARSLYERIEKKIFKTILETAEKMELNRYEYRDGQINEICTRRRSFELKKAIYYIKQMATEQAKYIVL